MKLYCHRCLTTRKVRQLGSKYYCRTCIGKYGLTKKALIAR
jgi:hypothetical protein